MKPAVDDDVKAVLRYVATSDPATYDPEQSWGPTFYSCRYCGGSFVCSREPARVQDPTLHKADCVWLAARRACR